MARLKRRVVATYRVAVRYSDTTTRTQCREVVNAKILKQESAMDPDIAQRLAFRVSSSRKEYDDLECELFSYVYDVTALI